MRQRSSAAARTTRTAVSAAGSTNSSASHRCLSLPSGWSHTPAGVPSPDTAACWSRYCDLPVAAVPSTATNLKVTFPEDLAIALRLS